MNCGILSKILNFFGNRRKYSKDYIESSHIKEIIEQSEKFAENKLVLIYYFDEYVQEVKNSKRESRVTLLKLVIYTYLYKLFVMGFIDDIRIRLLIMDYTLNFNGNRLLYSLAFSSLGFIFLVIPFRVQYLEMSRQMPILKIYYLIKYRIIQYPLTSNHYQKFCFYLKIMSSMLFNSFLNTLAIIVTFCHIFTFGSYPMNGLEIYSIFGQILGNITFFSTFYYASAYVIMVVFVWFSSIQYLKFKFEEINTKIELSLKQKNIRLLMNAIHEHNYVEILTRDINFLLSRLIFILYYILTLTSQLFLYISQREDTLLIHRIFFRFYGISYVLFLLAMNITCNQLCSRAHKSYPMLFLIIFNENIRMSLKQRLKLWSFVEKLSGRQIGFYCYDLFAMNSNRFHHYLCIYVSNYILIVNLFP